MSVSDYAKRVVLGLFFVCIFLVVWKLRDLLILTFGSLVFAGALVTGSLWLSERTFLSRAWAVGAIMGSLLLLTVGFVTLTVPTVSDQLDKLGPQISKNWKEVKAEVFKHEMARKFIPSLSGGKKDKKELVKKSLEVVSGTFGALGSLLLLTIMSLYFSLSPHFYRDGLMELFHPKYREPMGELLTKMRLTLSWWLTGRVLSMFVVAVLTTLGLWIVGVELAFVLGLLAGLLSFVPNIGPVVSVVPAMLVAFSQGSSQLIGVLAVYGVVQLVESYLVTPLIQERTAALPPVLLLFMQVAMGLLLGIWGVLFASPALACLLVITKNTYVPYIEKKSS